jgi:hypothetical protein
LETEKQVTYHEGITSGGLDDESHLRLFSAGNDGFLGMHSEGFLCA